MTISPDIKEKIRIATLEARSNYGGSDYNYARSLGINNSVYSRLKKGQTEGLLTDTKWLELGRKHNVHLRKENWKVSRTKVYDEIEGSLQFCKELSKSMVLVDDCGIGKTFCARHIARGMKNTFYFDCSQAKNKMRFIRGLARTVGIDSDGRYIDVKDNLKYYLSSLERPLIILDEAGDLDYTAFLDIKELWNATVGYCGWYMMGADGLRHKIERGIRHKKVGFREIFSRFSDEFIKLTPTGVDDKQAFYRQLVGDVATANSASKTKVNTYVKQCLTKQTSLRYLETLIKLDQQ